MIQQAMKRMNYSKINNINELHFAQKENDIRLKYIQSTLQKKISSIGGTLHTGVSLINLCNEYLLFASHIRFYHRAYLWLRTMSLNFRNRNNTEKKKNKRDGSKN